MKKFVRKTTGQTVIWNWNTENPISNAQHVHNSLFFVFHKYIYLVFIFIWKRKEWKKKWENKEWRGFSVQHITSVNTHDSKRISYKFIHWLSKFTGGRRIRRGTLQRRMNVWTKENQINPITWELYLWIEHVERCHREEKDRRRIE